MTSGNFSTVVAETLRGSRAIGVNVSAIVTETLRSIAIANPPFNFSTLLAESFRKSSTGAFNLSAIVTETLRSIAQPPVPTGFLFAVDSSGRIFDFNTASGFVEVGTFGTPAIQASIANDILYSLLPEAQSLGTWAILGAASGAVATPMTVPACLAASNQYAAVGGWSYASGVGFSDAANAYAQEQFAGVTPSGASLWNVSGFAWAEAQSVSGSPGSYVAWTPSDDWVLVSDPVNNLFRALQYSLGTLTQTETIAVGTPGQLSVTPDSAWALVSCAAGVEAIHYNGSSWAASGAVSLAACSAILALSATTAVAGCSSGAAFLTLGASGWATTSVSALSYVPTALATDGSGTIFAAGSGVAQILGGASGAYSGTAVDSLWQQGQFIVADPAGLLHVFGPAGSGYVQKSQSAAPSGTTFVAPIGTLLVAGDPAQTFLYQMTAPYIASRARYGMLSIYASGWTSASLPIGSLPEALIFNSTGQVAAATSDNNLVEMTVGGVVTTIPIAQFTGQPQTTPIGLSSLLASGGSLYGATCLNDSLVQIQ